MVDIIDARDGFSDDESIDLDNIEQYIKKAEPEQQSQSKSKKSNKWSKSEFGIADIEGVPSKKNKSGSSKKKKAKKDGSAKALQRTGSALDDDADYLPDPQDSFNPDTTERTNANNDDHNHTDVEKIGRRKGKAARNHQKAVARKGKSAQKKAEKNNKFKIQTSLQLKLDQILEDMMKAHTSDLSSTAQGKPGLAKLTLLPKAIGLLNNSAGHGYLVYNIKFYEAISKWLEVNSETKKLPNATIRTALIELIENFTKPIAADYLKTNNLGKSLKLMSKHSEETKKNKATLLKLIDRWHSEIFNIPTNYSAAQEDYFENDSSDDDGNNGVGARGIKRSVLVSAYIDSSQTTTQSKAGEDPKNGKSYPRARMPEASTMSYRMMPRNDVLEIELSETSFDSLNQRKERLKKLKLMKSSLAAAK